MSPSATFRSTSLRTVASAFSALLLAVGLLWASPAVAQDEPIVSVESQEADSGQAVDVPVNVADFDSIGAADLVVNYDPDVLTLSEEDGLIADAPQRFDANKAEPGELRISFLDLSGENPITVEDGRLLTVTFSGFSGGTSDVTFGGDSELADETATTIAAAFEGGVVSEQLATLSVGSEPEAELNGTVSVPLSGEDLQNVGAASIEVAFDDDVLRFEGLAGDSTSLGLQGNVSREGVVSIGGFDQDGATLGEDFVEVQFKFLGGSSDLSVLSGTEISGVSGDAIQTALESGTVSGDTPTLSFEDQNVQPGDTLSATMQASELRAVGAFSASVNFNPATLTFVGASNRIVDGLQAGNSGTGVVNVGFISEAPDGADPADNNGELVDLRFAVADGFSPGSTTDLTFDGESVEITNPNGTPYNTASEGGTFTAIDRQVDLATQALDLTADDTELGVTGVIAEAGDFVLITTDDGDNEFTDETVVGSSELGSELSGEELTVDVLGGDTDDAAPGDHAAHISTDGTFEGVVATSETAAIYGVAQFDWQDETTEGETGTVDVDAVEIAYGGEVGPDSVSVQLHRASEGERIGAFVGISQEDLAVNEVHENVTLDVIEPVSPSDENPERVESTIDETGDFFAMAHLGPASTDADGERIPAQEPPLSTTAGPGVVGDFANVNVGFAADVSRSFENATDPANYELVALPGAADVDVAETLSGEVGVNWRAFLETGNSGGDGNLQDYAEEPFNFRAGNGVWVIAQDDWSFEGTIPSVDPSDGTPSTALQDGWNVISNPLREDLSWEGVQAANGLDDVSLSRWTGEGGFEPADTLRSATSGEAYYVLNEAGLDSLDFTTGSGSGASLAKSGEDDRASKPRTVTLSAESGETSVTSSVTIGTDPGAEEASSYRAPPLSFGNAALRITPEGSEKKYMRMVSAAEEGARFDLTLQAAPGATVKVQAEDLPQDAGSDLEITLVDGSETHDLRAGPATVTVGEESGTAVLQARLGGDVAEQTAPDETKLQANYPNPFSERTTVEYALSEQSEVSIQVFNLLGQRVSTLAQGTKQAGTHRVELNADQLSSGKYFVRMEASGTTDTRQITVVR